MRNFRIIGAVSAALCATLLAGVCRAQTDLYVPTTKSAVYFFVRAVPAEGVAGFKVYRADAGSSDYQLLTPNPVTPIKDGAAILDLMGDQIVSILEQYEIGSPEMIFEDFYKRPDLYNLIMFFSLDMNRVFGRLYVDEAVETGATYRYRIALVDGSGAEKKSFDHEATVQAVEIESPKGFAGTAGENEARFSWDNPSEGFRGIGWDLYRKSSEEEEFKVANNKTISVVAAEGESKQDYLDTLLVNDVVYYYYLVGRDLVGNVSEPSETLEIRPIDLTPPAPPTGIQLDLKEGVIELLWAMNIEPDLASYDVYRGKEQNGEFVKLNKDPLPPDVVSYIDENVEEGEFQFYRLTAADKSGNVSDKSVSVSLVPPDKTPPASPIQVQGEGKTNKDGLPMARLQWERNEEKDLHGYYIFRGDAPEEDAMKRISSGVLDKGLDYYEDYTVDSGVSYYYSVAALDRSMNVSERSTPIQVVVPDAIPPRFPASFFGQADDGLVKFSWPSNSEPDLAGYRLYRTAKEGAADEDFEKVGEDIPKEDKSCVDETVQNGVKYWYYLKAFDASENESERSDIAEVEPRDYEPPVAPVGLAAAPTDKNILLTWEPNVEKDLAGYKALRSGLEFGVFEPISGDGLIPPDKHEFLEETIQPEQAFFYRFVAVDTSGNVSKQSEALGPLALVVQEAEGEGEEGAEVKDAPKGDGEAPEQEQPGK